MALLGGTGLSGKISRVLPSLASSTEAGIVSLQRVRDRALPTEQYFKATSLGLMVVSKYDGTVTSSLMIAALRSLPLRISV